ncbi:ComF family protein [Bifidobacterium sp. 64T4]|nr:ComF family protein [Bifidobacterium pongonis]
MAKSGAFNAGVLNAGAGGVSAVDGAASMGTAYEDAASMGVTYEDAANMSAATMSATANATPPQILVIPAPSSPQSMRARGRQHLWPLAKAVASELAAGGAESCAVNALGISRVHGKAVETTNARGRAARLKERLEVPDPGLIAGKNVLILDDIVTTGTTMRRCAEAVRGAGGHVIGGIALAAVPPPDELQEDTSC